MQNGSREDLAWAAGLFEGEGCFTFSNRVPMASVGSTDLDVVEHLRAVMGFGSVYPFTRTNPKTSGSEWKDGLQWTTTCFEHFQVTVAMLWPWLGKRRRARATEILLAYRARRVEMARGVHGGRLTLAGELFGKRSRDLTPAEYTEYRRVQVARNRTKRKDDRGHED